MFIQTEQTPNPETLKFLPGRVVLEQGTAFFKKSSESKNSPFASRLFLIEGVAGVFFGSDFITITKESKSDWQVLKPIIMGSIVDHYNSDEEILIKENSKEQNNQNQSSINKGDSDIVKQIKELLDTRVRPAVAMDGGDIVYKDFKEGIVYLHMQGACSGCPSSTATLKMGIENMLKHYVPEVKEVQPIDA
tara:strand:- start:81 stop:653 length:573 start_codon:yes stop_codon:yes gene_type:complete